MNAVFLGALLSSRLVVPPLSPCPSVFKYEHLKEEATWIGIISVPPPPPGIPLELNVHLQIPAALPTKYVGLVELAEKQVDVARRIARSDNLPVKYKVRFPLFKPLPIVRRIYVNNQVICSDRKVAESGSIVTDIHLKHSLIPIPAESYSNNEKIQDQDDEDETDINKTTQLALDDTCGLSTPTNLLMAGGRVARHGEWPWLAAIFVNNELGLQFQCSGIIISNRFILTGNHIL
uniref:Peptidase S1 domain-containing protein n=1 Tax=Clastoptera arizonana TaxID=38151 RepID=A0A1B6CTU5_9HEMI